MPLYITQDNKLHDDADGYALSLPSWPKDARVATNEEINAIQNPSETNEQTITRLESVIDKYLDEQAKSLRYESIKTIVTYRDDPNPKFKAEGIAGYQLRSAVYTLSIQLNEDVLNGIKKVPTEEELLASLPKITDYLVY